MKPYLPRPPHWMNGQAAAPRSGGDDLSEFSHAFCSFVVVAAASGPVGSLVGQLAELAGARAVGIAGGREKCRSFVEEFRFDAAVDHRAPDFAEKLAAACPNGIDVYFENVDGAIWQAVLPLLNTFARVPVCGLIAQYNATGPAPGPTLLPATMREVLSKSLTLRGYINYVSPPITTRRSCALSAPLSPMAASAIARTSPMALRMRQPPSSTCWKAAISAKH
jgi:NADPH:quinone reductase-like Zn-dependent oxidoreductase